jgi:hypothetical protein
VNLGHQVNSAKIWHVDSCLPPTLIDKNPGLCDLLFRCKVGQGHHHHWFGHNIALLDLLVISHKLFDLECLYLICGHLLAIYTSWQNTRSVWPIFKMMVFSELFSFCFKTVICRVSWNPCAGINQKRYNMREPPLRKTWEYSNITRPLS